jgi:hypothetical protein
MSVNSRDYNITIDQDLDRHVCTLSKIVFKLYTLVDFLQLMMMMDHVLEAVHVGVPNTGGIPCHHMCVLVKKF